ncbi:hypothetical protein D781_2783 [Serratia sp. FGI94]|uniref:T6SS amidase immunity protein Tai4 family protein n=1 Tax=Serratia sp. FGI94 TaxID=671990 RepID=UPI0002A70016|nr:T6SS amidase immunity protein Tai4 family protein [Serratia sp. FGI94]AGB83034.1 hypothetical protein D781_2783 [Serratia sp. FGI94]
MKKTMAFSLFLVAGYTMAQSSMADWPPQAAHRSYLQNYKDIALTYCISVAYKKSPEASKDAIASSGGIDAWSDYIIRDEASPIIALTKEYLAKNYHAKDGKSSLNLMKCMDMYHGKELDRLAKEYVERPSANWVQDNPESIKP